MGALRKMQAASVALLLSPMAFTTVLLGPVPPTSFPVLRITWLECVPVCSACLSPSLYMSCC